MCMVYLADKTAINFEIAHKSQTKIDVCLFRTISCHFYSQIFVEDIPFIIMNFILITYNLNSQLLIHSGSFYSLLLSVFLIGCKSMQLPKVKLLYQMSKVADEIHTPGMGLRDSRKEDVVHDVHAAGMRTDELKKKRDKKVEKLKLRQTVVAPLNIDASNLSTVRPNTRTSSSGTKPGTVVPYRASLHRYM